MLLKEISHNPLWFIGIVAPWVGMVALKISSDSFAWLYLRNKTVQTVVKEHS